MWRHCTHPPYTWTCWCLRSKGDDVMLWECPDLFSLPSTFGKLFREHQHPRLSRQTPLHNIVIHISSDTHQLQYIKLHHFKLEICCLSLILNYHCLINVGLQSGRFIIYLIWLPWQQQTLNSFNLVMTFILVNFIHLRNTKNVLFTLFYRLNISYIASYDSNATSNASETLSTDPNICYWSKQFWTVAENIECVGMFEYSAWPQPSWTPSWKFKIAQGWQLHITLDLIIHTPKMNNRQRKNYIRDVGVLRLTANVTQSKINCGMCKQHRPKYNSP